jgi:hypothetical protein
MNQLCEHCKERPAIMTLKGPMIWNADGGGLWRPQKDICDTCARDRSTDELFPLTHPLDCRQPFEQIAARTGLTPDSWRSQVGSIGRAARLKSPPLGTRETSD